VNPIYDLGIQIIQALQTMSPALNSLMKFITQLGTINFYLLVIPFVYWVVSAPLGLRVLLVFLSTDFLGLCSKQLLRQPRPYWIGDVKALAPETSYGLASTHASDSIAVWGYLSYRLKKNWLWAFSILLVLLIGISRMYLGVHFPTDVLGGWLIGLVVVFLFVKGEPWLLPWLNRQSGTGKIGIGFVVSIVMILVGWLINLLIAPIPDPPEWAEYALQARGISHYIILAGALFGTVTGHVLMQQHAAFQTKGTWWKRLLRYVLGIIGVLVINFSLDVLFGMIAADETTLGLVLRYIRYGAVTLWATFGAPWVFIKIKLAERARK
jgi:membrane-associated phospholipid phosphatase